VDNQPAANAVITNNQQVASRLLAAGGVSPLLIFKSGYVL